MNVYQVQVNGHTAILSEHKVYSSRKVFVDKAQAEAYAPEMVAEVTTPKNEHDFDCLSPATVKVCINTLEYVSAFVRIIGGQRDSE